MEPTTLLELIRSLSRVAAPSGHEDAMVALVSDRLQALGLRPVIDRIGNVAVNIGPESPEHPTLVFAHLDEIGLVVRRIDPEGFLRVERLGGVPERVLPGTAVQVHGRRGAVPGVVGLKAHHLTPPDERYLARPVTDLYLDVGAASDAEVAALGLRVGDPVTYAPSWIELAGGRFAAKSLDDRLGVAALLALAELLVASPPPGPVVLAFSVQEEFNVRGSLALAAAYAPAVAIGLDITPATDPPDLHGRADIHLGGGPVLSRLTFHGRGTLGGLVPHPALVDAVVAAASAAGVNLQYSATVGVITDAAFLPMATPRGIAAVDLALAVRYTHSPIETAQLSDVTDMVALLDTLLRHMPEVDLHRGVRRLSG